MTRERKLTRLNLTALVCFTWHLIVGGDAKWKQVNYSMQHTEKWAIY